MIFLRSRINWLLMRLRDNYCKIFAAYAELQFWFVRPRIVGISYNRVPGSIRI
jgi:hypothetical protein